MRTWTDLGIELKHGASGEVDTTCPKCSPERKKRHARCLSVNVELGTFLCHHCGYAGSLQQGEQRVEPGWRKPIYRKPDPRPETDLPATTLEWFLSRAIGRDVVLRNRIQRRLAYMPQVEDHVPCIVFAYRRNGELVNAKYRDKDKNFRMEGGAERILYGYDDMEDTTIIVEGELDKLSMEQAGFRNCVSVPDGAPTPEAKNYASKFSFLDDDRVAAVKEWIIAVDGDAPGCRLEEELCRRFGAEKCRRVAWPEGCKDANDVLVKLGAPALKARIESAQPFPLTGVIEVNDLSREIEALYDQGVKRGLSTGWKTLDEFYTVRPGELTVVSGVPNSGKSNWVDGLTVNLSREFGWHHAVFSPENQPLANHISRLMEHFRRVPFRDGPTARMTREEMHYCREWLQEHYRFILPESEEEWRMDFILERAAQLVRRFGINGVVIDPWNELQSTRPERMTETEFVSVELRRLRQFARRHQVHVWLVAHPAKLYRNKDGQYPVPSLYDISGCYSDDTEVLTKRGWLPHSAISLMDEVGCFNPASGTMHYCRPTAVIRKEYSGPMHRYRGYGYDLLVTPEHRMVVMPDWKDPNGRQAITGIGRPTRFPKGQWSFCESARLPTASNFKIPLAASLYDGPTDHVPELLARLAGWYVSEGSAVSSGVSISQGIGEKANQIEAILVALSLPYSIQHSAPGGKGGTIPMKNFYIGVRGAREVVGWLRSQCGIGSANKRIPKAIFDSSSSVKSAFLEAYLAGDGCEGRSGTFRATTTSRGLRDDLQRLALELSMSSSWHERAPVSDRHAVSWQINIGRKDRQNTALCIRRNGSIEHYNGVVWCLTVPTGAYFVRRNGRAVVCGNSAHFRNKADNGIVLWRDLNDPGKHSVEIHVQKIRFREVGKVGGCELKYDPATGAYSDWFRNPGVRAPEREVSDAPVTSEEAWWQN